MGSTGSERDRGRTKALLWLLAVLLMFVAAAYQRRTGPSYPLRGSLSVAGREYPYGLIRSGKTGHDARVVAPRPEDGAAGIVFYKRYKTDDPLTRLPMKADDGDLVADLPHQPAAGKLEYFVEIVVAGETFRLPESHRGNAVIRFKNPVPAYVLVPHIVLMFFSILIGVRAGLAAVWGLRELRLLAWIALAGMSVGGMILGPVVQKYAFGEFWTGFPFGYDLTDNKMLIMWVVWVAACTTLLASRRKLEGAGRVAVILAAVVMTVVYLIPHSMRGSELDYEKLDRGVPASDAIQTGE